MLNIDTCKRVFQPFVKRYLSPCCHCLITKRWEISTASMESRHFIRTWKSQFFCCSLMRLEWWKKHHRIWNESEKASGSKKSLINLDIYIVVFMPSCCFVSVPCGNICSFCVWRAALLFCTWWASSGCKWASVPSYRSAGVMWFLRGGVRSTETLLSTWKAELK